MKTTDFIRTLLVFTLCFIANVTIFAGNPDGKLIYNAEEVDGVKVSETVYKMNNGLLTNYEKYCYKYNDNKQVTENLMQIWDGDNKCWNNHMCIRYIYTNSDVTINYYEWNEKKNDFILLPDRTVTMQN
ncbi:DUF3836 domain-containing protein [uncultured Bacteroides sp.]|uniref:DUF3836 domain-containing protein n=1 Tax=uncultured Bacteroides sp. TaxID=162156 RepID=UPI002631237C|nr:DUF3836 domain-containing protein [uncultured Bacteroides sp.]